MLYKLVSVNTVLLPRSKCVEFTKDALLFMLCSQNFTCVNVMISYRYTCSPDNVIF